MKWHSTAKKRALISDDNSHEKKRLEIRKRHEDLMSEAKPMWLDERVEISSGAKEAEPNKKIKIPLR